jgi:type II secretory pathway component PulK
MARNQAPTLKQIKTLQYMNQGMTVHRAMKEAGYSQSSLVQSSKFKKSPVVQKMMSGLKSKLVDKGFTVDFLADKFMEWMQAEKTVVSKFGEVTNSDYDTQIKAYDRAKEILDIKETDPKIKRKLTIEEFVNEDKGENGD